MLIPRDGGNANVVRRLSPAAYPAAESAEVHGAVSEPGIRLQELVQFLRERAWLIVGFGAFGATVGFSLAGLLPRSFQADGLLVMDTQEINIPDFQTIRSQGTVEPWGARSAARILVSREVVEKAAQKLELENDPDFNAALRPSYIEAALESSWLPAWLRQRVDMSGIRELLGSSPPDKLAAWTDLVDSVRRDLRADSEERSYAITLGFTGRHPDTTAQIVNTVMNEFVEQELVAKRRAMINVGAQLQRETQQLSVELQETWAKIQSLENRASAVTTSTGTVAAQRLMALAQEGQTVDNEQARVHADLEQVGAAQREGQANLLNPDLVTPRLRALLTTDASLRHTSVESANRFGPKYPQMQALNTELGRVAAEIGREMKAVQSSLQQRLDILQKRGKALRAEADRTGQAAAASAGDRAELEQLRADAQSRQQLYSTYQQRYQQTLANLQIIQPSVRVASRAVPPFHPSSPGRGFLTAAAALGSMLMAIVGILGRRWLGARLETLSEVSLATGMPALGGIPRAGGGFSRSEIAVPDQIPRWPQGLITETVRGILLRIQSVDGPVPKVIMVASPQAGDGKTNLSLSLARVAAREGLRVLCIDADFRRPSLARRAGLNPHFALNDLFDGDAVSLDQAVTCDPASSAHVLGARRIEGDLRPYQEYARFDRLFALARARYDLVVVDTPPVLRVIDPLLIAPLADAVVLVISQGGVTREMLHETVQRLLRSRARIAGAVMVRMGGRIPEEYVYAGYASR